MADLDAVLELIDDLLEQGVDIDALLTRVAAALEAPIGVEVATGPHHSARPDGSHGAEPAPPGAAVRVLPDGARVWIADLTQDSAAANRLLRRLSVAARLTLLLSSTGVPTSALRTAADATAEHTIREQALRHLGMSTTTQVTTFAVFGETVATAALVERLRHRSPAVLQESIGRITLVVAKDLGVPHALAVPVGLRVAFAGPSPAVALPEAWRQAALALRFTLPSRRESSNYLMAEAVLVDSDAVGGYLQLAEVLTPALISEVRDVRRLDDLMQEQGADLLDCLEVVAVTDSIRKAAGLLHLHHNSVAHRVKRAERQLGFSCLEPYGRTRLFLALTLRRLRESQRLFGSEPDGAPPQPNDS